MSQTHSHLQMVIEHIIYGMQIFGNLALLAHDKKSIKAEILYQ